MWAATGQQGAGGARQQGAVHKVTACSLCSQQQPHEVLQPTHPPRHRRRSELPASGAPRAASQGALAAGTSAGARAGGLQPCGRHPCAGSGWHHSPQIPWHGKPAQAQPVACPAPMQSLHSQAADCQGCIGTDLCNSTSPALAPPAASNPQPPPALLGLYITAAAPAGRGRPRCNHACLRVAAIGRTPFM